MDFFQGANAVFPLTANQTQTLIQYAPRVQVELSCPPSLFTFSSEKVTKFSMEEILRSPHPPPQFANHHWKCALEYSPKGNDQSFTK